MTIALLEPLAAGNAVRLIPSRPPAGAVAWRALRRRAEAAPPSGPDDNQAALVADWGDWDALVDTDGLENGQAYRYALFYRDADGAEILPRSAPRTVRPEASARDLSPDVPALVRARVEAHLAACVTDGQLTPRERHIPVVASPSVDAGRTSFPIVAVQLESDRPAERAIGDLLSVEESEALDAAGFGDPLDEQTGWLSDISVAITCVSLNPDERATLGRAVRHGLVANLPVWAANGLLRPAASITHSEMTPDEKGGVALYIAAVQFTCLAPTVSAAQAPALRTARVRMGATLAPDIADFHAEPCPLP